MPKRSAFFSFHYEPDNWRASQVRNIGVVEGNPPARDNDWEAIKKGGERAIQNWIDAQLKGRSCTIVLIGQNTAKRKWIDYEIENSWNSNKGVLGIHIHNLKDRFGYQSSKGQNPFSHFTMNRDGTSLANIVPVYDPPYWDSQQVYRHIAANLSSWIENAISVRNSYG